jgi:hypothetical protein
LYEKDQKGKKPFALLAMCECLGEVSKISKDYAEGAWYSYETSECGKYLYEESEQKIKNVKFAKVKKEKIISDKETHDWSGREKF